MHEDATMKQRVLPFRQSAMRQALRVLAVIGPTAVGCVQAAPAGEVLGQTDTVGEASQGLTSSPVCVDIQRQGSAGTVFDTQLQHGTPSLAYGSSPSLATSGQGGAERRSLLRVDLSDIPSGPDTVVTSATLFLALNLSQSVGLGTLSVQRVMSPWNESTVTWDAFNGSFDATPFATFASGVSRATVDVRTLVSGWVQGAYPNHGLLLMDMGGAVTTLWSSESPTLSLRPRLRVCFTVTCRAGFGDCNRDGTDGCETDLSTSTSQCGTCGHACTLPNASPACVNGVCQVTACAPGFGDCNAKASDGCETDLNASAAHCGACGHDCAPANASPACVNGACQIATCKSGFDDCNGNLNDGCEANLANTTAHCGACGHACVLPHAEPKCATALCQIAACEPGFDDCNRNPNDGCETALTTGTDCGGCGKVCARANAVTSCATGTCALLGCNDGSFDCDGDPQNGCESSRCNDGGFCASGSACRSGVCAGGLCQPATCTDGVQNGAETDVDCGGNLCPACPSSGPAFNLAQTLSDGAQRTTLAFSGLALMTGNLEAQSFFPPGKVADYTGFQFLRDNDPDHMGHNTSFLTRIAYNVLYILNDTQLDALTTLAIAQMEPIQRYGYQRFPLMKAFRRLLLGDLPAGSQGLNLDALKQASRALYLLDGQISFDRALLYANILASLDASQKAYLDAMKGKGWRSWPNIERAQLENKMSSLPRGTSVAVMTYAGDLFSWYAGSLEADVYFCPERHGTYYGSFYIKDAPAIGHEGYSIDEQLTATAGAALSDSAKGYVTLEQASALSSLVAIQRDNLFASPTASIVKARTTIAELLRSLLTSTATSNTVRDQVLAWSALYGELDGENNYAYATVFASVYATLTQDQKTHFDQLRHSILSGTYADGTPFDDTVCTTPFLYSTPITDPNVLASYLDASDALFFQP